ncbi:MAG TPA: hypothetical protein VE665_07130 [Hyphomicrobiaceae bacterium]|nr:hypothetical protein [Hyphomicrobiaceae bacterium]
MVSRALSLARPRFGVATWLLEALQQFLEAVGNALAQHLVVDALKDVTDPSLILATEAPSGPSHLRVGMHGRL